MEKNLKNIRQQFRKAGVFYTPEKLAEKMKEKIVGGFTTVYDPTCGAGNLLAVFGDEVKKFGIELDPIEVEKAQGRLKNATIKNGNTFEVKDFNDVRFDVVMMNPPYSIKWDGDLYKNLPDFAGVPCLPPNSKADYAFLLHALHRTKDGVQVIALMHPGILYRGQREGKIRQWLCEQGLIEEVINIPGGQFEDTPIATVLLVLRKGRQDKHITFDDGDKKRIVPFEEIKRNDFNLSVQQYIFEEVKKEEIDIVKIENEARAVLIDKVKAELAFSKFTGELSQAENHKQVFNSFIDNLIAEIQAMKY